MTMSDRIAGILLAFPDRAVNLIYEPQGFRVGFGTDGRGAYTPPRATPEAAIEYFHNVLVQGAEKGLGNASKHLSTLTLATVPVDAAPTGSQSDGG